MRHLAVFGTVCILALGAGGWTLEGHAADLDQPFPAPMVTGEPDAQFEFGSGWYLRGDASFGPEDHPVLTAGLGRGFDTTKQDWNYMLGGGVGYKFNTFLRFDVTGDWMPERAYSAAALDAFGNPLLDANNAALINKAHLAKYDGLANLYIDLGTWYGLTPYVGGGAGFAVFDPSETLSVPKQSGYLADNTGSRTTFAWAGMAGVSYQFDSNVAVDLGYRHLDLGRFSTTLIGYKIDHHYSEDQVRVGLRYMIF